MVNPVSDHTNRLIVPLNGSSKHRDPSQEKDGLSLINVSLSGKASELKMFESDLPLIGILKKEFKEAFKYSGDEKDSFLKKLDNILLDNKT